MAFTDAVAPDGGVLSLTVHPRGWQWDLIEAELGVPVYQVSQVHGANVVVVHSGSSPDEVAEIPADALVSPDAGLGLAVRVADCVPVLLSDGAAGVIAAAHAGRAGLLVGVLERTVETMRSFGAKRIMARIGPHVCGECYEVPADMRADFCSVIPLGWATTSWGTPAIDLGRSAESVLNGMGVQVERRDPCTRTTPTLHSYRRDQQAAGRMAGIVWR
ncbi:MAG: polyphenol oxidase family protein [Propionibacteriaceae bacterium]|nr:polyphenol oxidase family protein [Propionibacteriaceae bacterium]